MSSLFFFEHPLNERIRTFLRLEHLFEKIDHFRLDPSPWGTRATIDGLLDILAITARSDVRNELQKELERNMATLGRVRRQEGADIDLDTLDTIVGQLETASARIVQINGQIAAGAREDDFLKAVVQRSSIPGGACSFDLPHYHYLLTRPAEARARHFERWSQDLDAVRDAVRLVLSLARTSATPRQVSAPQGFFQEALDPAAPAQLVRVGIDGDLGCFPEISGHRNRFSIRFLASDETQKPVQSRDAVLFTLVCCVF